MEPQNSAVPPVPNQGEPAVSQAVPGSAQPQQTPTYQPPVESAAQQAAPEVAPAPAPGYSAQPQPQEQPQPQAQTPLQQLMQPPQASGQMQPASGTTSSSAQNATPVLKNMHRGAVTGIILGVLYVLIGGVTITGTGSKLASVGTLVLGVVILAASIGLLKAHNIARVLVLARVLTLAVVLLLIESLVQRGSPGIVVVLLELFVVKGIKDLYKSGSITANNIFTAKPTASA